MNKQTLGLVLGGTALVIAIGLLVAYLLHTHNPQPHRPVAISDLPAIKTPEQKEHAQEWEAKVNDQLNKLDAQIAALRQAAETIAKTDPPAAAAKKAQADNLEGQSQAYVKKEDAWHDAATKDMSQAGPPPLPPSPETPANPNPPSGDSQSPAAQQSDAKASDDQQQLLQIAALGVCIVQPEFCLVATAVAGLLGGQSSDSVQAAVKLFAGDAPLTPADVQSLLAAAKKDPALASKLTDFLDAANKSKTDIGKKASQIVDTLNTSAGNVLDSPVIREMLRKMKAGAPCSSITQPISGQFASDAQKQGLYSLILMSKSPALDNIWKNCLDNIPSN
jgi:hypothetical protein